MSERSRLRTIKKSISEYFGDDLDYALIKTGASRYIMVTPYLDDRNDYIELELYIDNRSKLVITDFGNALDYLLQEDMGSYGKEGLYAVASKIAGYIGVDINENKLKIKSGLRNAGENISRLIRSLQRVYNLNSMIGESSRSEFGRILNGIYKSYYTGNANYAVSSAGGKN